MRKSNNLGKIIDQYLKSLNSDYIINSYPKSGRTWICFMLGFYINELYKSNIPLDEINLLNNSKFYNLLRKKIYFTHFGRPQFLHHKYQFLIPLKILNIKKCVFIARNPLNVIDSFYSQYHYREAKFRSSAILSTDFDEFVLGNKGGISSIIKYYNRVYQNSLNNKNHLILKYEDFIEDSESQLIKLISFFDLKISNQLVIKSIEMSNKSNMAKLEKLGKLSKKHFGGSGNSAKVRNSKGLFKRSKNSSLLLNKCQNIIDIELNKYYKY